MTRRIDWSDDNPVWGQAGHNVHVASNGSHVDDHHTEGGHG